MAIVYNIFVFRSLCLCLCVCLPSPSIASLQWTVCPFLMQKIFLCSANENFINIFCAAFTISICTDDEVIRLIILTYIFRERKKFL